MHKLVWPNEQNQIRIASHKKCSAGYKRHIKEVEWAERCRYACESKEQALK